MIADKNPYIESAYQTLQVISQDKQKRLEYEAREKAIRDHNQFLWEAQQKGRAEGKQEGRKEGIEAGEKRINTLNNILINSNRIDDLKRAATDKTFQSQLIDELLPNNPL